jgi:hypothetical protein
VVFDFRHFQSLIVIENGGPSLVRSGSALNQRFPRETLEKAFLGFSQLGSQKAWFSTSVIFNHLS